MVTKTHQRSRATKLTKYRTNLNTNGSREQSTAAVVTSLTQMVRESQQSNLQRK
jgi:hypothetical protein